MKRRILFFATLGAAVTKGCLAAALTSAEVVQPWHPKAPPLAAAASRGVVRVSKVEELFRALETAKPNSMVLIADGHYSITRPLQISTSGLNLRSASGQRGGVVLDGGGSLGEGIRITGCTGVTIADLTLENIRWNGIKIDSETGVQQATIYNCVLHNIWQRGIKGVMVPLERRGSASPSGCVIRYCLFYNDRAKRYVDDPADTPENFQGNYIGGIDAMYVRGWTISDNVFIGLQGRTQEGRGAIFLWQDSRDCRVERNIIVDCDAGISLGNPQRAEADQIHCSRFLVRNNFLTRVPENGIFAAYTRDCKILHNTIYDPESSRGRLIRVFSDNAGLSVMNNLVIGPPLSNQSGAPLALHTNVVVPKLELLDPLTGNLHLTRLSSEAIGHVGPVPEVEEDIDRVPRGSRPNAGAHDWGR
ncbi:MAG: right-handed parallel beta-helix repeat-containing protein [Verrucomicrobiota bacterium]